jgi:hypothetical protein
VDTVPFSGTAAVSDAGLLAMVHADAIRFWDVRTGTEARTVPAPDGIRQVWFVPGHEALLATFADGQLLEITGRRE